MYWHGVMLSSFLTSLQMDFSRYMRIVSLTFLSCPDSACRAWPWQNWQSRVMPALGLPDGWRRSRTHPPSPHGMCPRASDAHGSPSPMPEARHSRCQDSGRWYALWCRWKSICKDVRKDDSMTPCQYILLPKLKLNNAAKLRLSERKTKFIWFFPSVSHFNEVKITYFQRNLRNNQ